MLALPITNVASPTVLAVALDAIKIVKAAGSTVEAQRKNDRWCEGLGMGIALWVESRSLVLILLVSVACALAGCVCPESQVNVLDA